MNTIKAGFIVWFALTMTFIIIDLFMYDLDTIMVCTSIICLSIYNVGLQLEGDS